MPLVTTRPTSAACASAGGAIARRVVGTDSFVPDWAAGVWVAGAMVKTQAVPGGPWQLFVATVPHGAASASPTTGVAGWLALSASTTAIAPWVQHNAYIIGQPVRIDVTAGEARLFIASKGIADSNNSPDSAAGIAEGWEELVVNHPVPAPLFNPDVSYRVGDMVQFPAGQVWVCKAPHAPHTGTPSVAGADWSNISVGAEVAALTARIAALEARTPVPLITSGMGDPDATVTSEFYIDTTRHRLWHLAGPFWRTLLQGVYGRNLHTGAGVPTLVSASGDNGDLYYDTTANEWYLHTGGAWVKEGP
jgi:hypothetical protein